MCTTSDQEFGAEQLLAKCREMESELSPGGQIKYDSFLPGKHATQRGGFEISLKEIGYCIYVWSGGRIEIMSMNNVGVQLEIETFEEVSLNEAVQRIFEHIARHSN